MRAGRLLASAAVAALAATGTAGAGGAGPRSDDDAAACEREIVELHRFLEDWSNAVLENTDEAFARFDRALAEEFVLVGPDAEIVERAAIVAAIRGAWGRWREDPGRIRIENVRLWHRQGDLRIATYEEWHDRGGASRGRLSTAVFRAAPEAPAGLEWLHLHEVWLPDPADD